LIGRKAPFSLSLSLSIRHEFQSHKHLGITISQNGKWNEHIQSIVSKACSRLNLLRKLLFTIDRKSLQILYFSLVRPIMEYGDIVWDNIPNN